MAHDFLSHLPGEARSSTCLAIAYLLLFIPFWRYVQGGKAKEVAVRARRAARPPPRAAAAPRAPPPGWFQLPAGVHLHPGHTWARLETDGLVSVGIDDFAHKLVGPARVELPRARRARRAGRARPRDRRRGPDASRCSRRSTAPSSP